MQTVAILHGIGGHAGIHWQGWLSEQLTEAGFTVLMPNLSNPSQPDRTIWLKELVGLLSSKELKDLIIVAHSLSTTSALDFIEQSSESIYGFISVSGFAQDYQAELNGYFLKEKQIDFEQVRDKLDWAEVIFGDDDPYVPQNILNQLANDLKVRPKIIVGGGHLNTQSGYSEFPRLLEIIQNKVL